MTDKSVKELLDSEESLVVIEAPAGCGKTFQGAHYASRIASALKTGRVLILTHTHAACAAFASTTSEVSRKVEIRTIDSLIVQIAAAYHRSLGLPPDPGAWATVQRQDGYATLATRTAALLYHHPKIAASLVRRYPVVIADEHQDSTAEQHDIIMSLHAAGARLRIFGDPMQCIFSRANTAADQARWNALKGAGSFDELDTPHRWSTGSPELGLWVLAAREALKGGDPVQVPDSLPRGLSIHYADNTAQRATGYGCTAADRRPIDRAVNEGDPLLILTSNNDLALSLRAFWNRRLAIWEGHTREALTDLVSAITRDAGDADALATALVEFLSLTTVGFSPSAFGDRFRQEVQQGCTGKASGKPARLQAMARHIVNQPSHIGVSKCLALLDQLRAQSLDGFGAVVVDHRSEFKDAIRLGSYASAEEALSELHRRRAFARPMPPARAISTVHKAKGLECDNALLIPCDRQRFGNSAYARCRLYVALSRAKTTLSLVVSRTHPSPLIRF